MGLNELEAICQAVLKRRDLDKDDRKFWNEQLAWVKAQKMRDTN